jgi:hypothetical protein
MLKAARTLKYSGSIDRSSSVRRVPWHGTETSLVSIRFVAACSRFAYRGKIH